MNGDVLFQSEKQSKSFCKKICFVMFQVISFLLIDFFNISGSFTVHPGIKAAPILRSTAHKNN